MSRIKLGIKLALLIGLIVQVYASANKKEWYEHAEIYQIYPRSFKDSDGDGIGDLPGITSKLQHLKDIGVNTIWLSPMFQSPQVDVGYDVSDFKEIHDEYGTMADFEAMMSEIKRLGLKILLDFVPNHSSDQHEWFQKSVNKEEGYEDFYVWSDGKPNPDDEQPLLPNNWVSVFGGAAWTWNDVRKQYYLHQFKPEQPDLNYRNALVKAEMVSVLEFWLTKGIDGFRFDAINHMFETENFPDEPKSERANPGEYDYLNHIHTKDLPEVYDVVASWRKVIDDYAKKNGGDTRIIMTEAYTSIENTMKYYQSEDGKTEVAHMPFNFWLIYDITSAAVAESARNAVNMWLDHMPSHKTPNWVLGSHDHSRAGSRIGEKQIDMLNALVLTLPGTSITYYGDEIGMLDYHEGEIADSRDPNRTPMQWDDTISAGFSNVTTTWLPVNPNYETENVAAQNGKPLTHLEIFKSLTRFRNEKTMIHGEYIPKIITANVFAFTRELYGNDSFVVIFNFDEQQVTTDVSGFVNINHDLTVEVISSKSKYIQGEAIRANFVQLDELDFLILRSTNACDSQAKTTKILLSLISCSLLIKFIINW
jgi:alpha-glucosidase